MKGKKVKKRLKKKRSKAENAVTADRDQIVDDQAVCIKAPEWAEHQRLWEDDEPCDDGRSGKLDP